MLSCVELFARPIAAKWQTEKLDHLHKDMNTIVMANFSNMQCLKMVLLKWRNACFRPLFSLLYMYAMLAMGAATPSFFNIILYGMHNAWHINKKSRFLNNFFAYLFFCLFEMIRYPMWTLIFSSIET